jgi:formylglycine-generating enzyme required for sulfatase activity
MGSDTSFLAWTRETPSHAVTVSSFFIAKYEVTQKAWIEVMGNNPSNFKGDDLPVEQVSWNDAVEYCNKRSEKEGLKPCYSGSGNSFVCNFSANGYRLPTEAEWEFAAKGGTLSKGYTFAGSNDVDTVAWTGSNSRNSTHTVGSKGENELGLYDMSGNVTEFCWDWFGEYTNGPVTNPTGPNPPTTLGVLRVMRGGDWLDESTLSRVELRIPSPPDSRQSNYGLRLVRRV